MATREELLQHLWTEIINAYLREDAINNIIANSKRFPDGPIGEVGRAIERILAAGASRRDLSQVLRSTAYEAVFGTLYALGDPGVDDDNVFGLHEELWTAEPSGLDGRPGSA